MKRLFLVVACLVVSLAVAAPVKAATLGFGELIGWVEPGAPADSVHEIYYANMLLNMYNNDAPSVLLGHIKAGDQAGQFNDYYLYTGNMNTFGVGSQHILGLVPESGVTVKDETVPFFPIGLSPTAYDYALVKFGQFSAFFYLGGIDTIDGVALGGDFDRRTEDVSHVTLFNPISVPEAGALLLFGTGLVGLVGYRRVRRMQ